MNKDNKPPSLTKFSKLISGWETTVVSFGVANTSIRVKIKSLEAMQPLLELLPASPHFSVVIAQISPSVYPIASKLPFLHLVQIPALNFQFHRLKVSLPQLLSPPVLPPDFFVDSRHYLMGGRIFTKFWFHWLTNMFLPRQHALENILNG